MSQISENAVAPWKTKPSKLSSYTGSCTETGPPPRNRMQRLLLDPTLTYQNHFFFAGSSSEPSHGIYRDPTEK